MFLVCIVLVIACNHKPKASELLKDDDTRHAIMTAISSNHDMATEMVSYLTNSSASVELMKGSCSYMETVLSSDVMKKDTSIQNLVITNALSRINRDSILYNKACLQFSNNPQVQRVLERRSKGK